MKILVLGAGAREHALSWCLNQNGGQIFCSPGNGGTEILGKNIRFSEDSLTEIISWVQKEKIDFTVVGPEALLCQGVVDRFQQAGLKIVGPAQKAAQLEGNKAYTKELLWRYQIPTASAKIFEDPYLARQFIAQDSLFPKVIKVVGLASGKGVFVIKNEEEGITVITQIMEQKIFGEAGNSILIEEYLQGEEVSWQALVVGDRYESFPLVRDYKRLNEKQTSPNTGGMGACGPMTYSDLKHWETKIIQPLLRGLVREQIHYQGILYLGLMLTQQGPKILEINCRFGDPEFSVLAMIQQGNWVETFLALSEGKLLPKTLKTKGFSVCIVKATSDYPWSKPQRIVFSLEKPDKRTQLFQGKTFGEEGRLVSYGGRVLEIASWGETEKEAYARAYTVAKQKHFQSEIYRQDIAQDWANTL